MAIEPDTGLVTAAVSTKASRAENRDTARGAQLIAADSSIAADSRVTSRGVVWFSARECCLVDVRSHRVMLCFANDGCS